MNALILSFPPNGTPEVRIELSGGSSISIGGHVGELAASTIEHTHEAAAPLSAPFRVDVAGGAIVVDHRTGLMWDASTTATDKTQSEAEAIAKACRLGGYEDWRLPTLDELETIRDIKRFNPAIDMNLFPDTKSAYYRTASPDASAPVFAWVVGFDYGYASLDSRHGRCCVRAVRSVARASQ